MGTVGHQSERYNGFHRIGNRMWGVKVFNKADSPYRKQGNTHSVFVNQSPLNTGSLPKDGAVPYDQVSDVRLLTADVKSARLGAYVLSRMGIEGTDLKKDGSVRFKVQDGSMSGDWCMSVQSFKPGLKNRVKQWLPFTREIENKHVTFVTINRLPTEASYLDRIKSCFVDMAPKFTISAPEEVMHVEMPIINTNQTAEERFCARPFTDAYTTLASFAFQNLETTFRHTLNPEPKFQFGRDISGNLTLVEVSKAGAEYEKMSGKKKLDAIEAGKEKNRRIVRTYRNFVMQEYGGWFIKDVKHRFGVDLEKMVKYGEPLLPEHVYRINVGAHEIDEPAMARIIYKVNHLMKSSAKLDKVTIAAFMAGPNAYKRHDQFSVREIRAIVRHIDNDDFDFNTATVKDLRLALVDMFGGVISRHVQDTNPKQLEALYTFLEPAPEDFDGMFTGRKITDHAIMGYYTRAEKTNFKPWLDLQELLQIHGDLSSTKDWDGYYELLSHVVSKKHNVVRDRDQFWRVGRMIPAPNAEDGSRRFYEITTCTDDNYGDFNYTMEPASKGYKDMPAIKLYRSTASDTYAMNGGKSVDADLSLSGPGASNREAADEYENKFFDNLTIPVWVGYTILAKKTREKVATATALTAKMDLVEESYKHLKMAWREKRNTDPEFTEEWKELDFSERLSVPRLKTREGLVRRIEAKLDRMARTERERPEDKKAYDIAFVGHSLGGSLAQGGLYHYGVSRSRIPLPDHKFVCYASDPPGMARHENANFLQFGRRHEKLLVGLGQKWKVTHQMEYGDPVPMGGSVHLGATTRFDRLYKNWLELDVRVFKPLDTAEATCITTAPTHGRRVGKGKEGRDYKFTHLTARELHKYDNNINPFGEGNRLLRDVFGYKILHSRRGVEAFRQGLATVRAPIQRRIRDIWKKVVPERGDEMRDENGAFHVRVRHSEILGTLC